MNVRWIQLHDIEGILELERLAYCDIDPDFSVPVYKEWVLTEKELLALVRQRNDMELGTYVNKLCVIETEDFDLLGAFAYELCPISFELTWFVLTPEVSADDLVPLIGDTLLEKASKAKKTINIYLRDREDAGLSHLLPAWTAYLRSANIPYRLKLLPAHYGAGDGSCDGWLLSFEAPEKINPRAFCRDM